jgi:hypothetical protein
MGRTVNVNLERRYGPGLGITPGRAFFLKIWRDMVGTTGFEPATSRTPSVRATRLRYVPTLTTPFSVSLSFEEGQGGEQLLVQFLKQPAADTSRGVRPRDCRQRMRTIGGGLSGN